jgi:transketolase C-terminal domain/subunit
MAKENNTSSHICLELALIALERAMSEIQLIEECDTNASEFQAHLPAVLDELKKAKYFMRGLKTAPTSMPMFSDN